MPVMPESPNRSSFSSNEFWANVRPHTIRSFVPSVQSAEMPACQLCSLLSNEVTTPPPGVPSSFSDRSYDVNLTTGTIITFGFHWRMAREAIENVVGPSSVFFWTPVVEFSYVRLWY